MITVDDRPWVPVKMQPNCRAIGKRCLEEKHGALECAPGLCAVQTVEPPRSAESYAAVLDSLPLLESPRYQPRDGATFCNIYVWDCTRLLGCEVPHWVDNDGRQSPAVWGREQTANDMAEWLQRHGGGHARGWRRCLGPEDAQSQALRGNPTAAVWRNPGGTGHIAMVRPGELDPVRGPCIAQAGKRNFRAGHVVDGFGTRPVEYFVHLL